MSLTSKPLVRFWFTRNPSDPFSHFADAVGVSAFSVDDAMRVIEAALDDLQLDWSADDIEKAHIVEDVDISLLDANHVIPNMGLVTERGIWWPRLK